MQLLTIKSEGLAHNSYYLSDDGEALAIDPRRDCSVYTRHALRNCEKIKCILETHRNEDFVIGSLELQNITEAEICHSKGLAFKYGEHNLSDGETLKIGNLTIKTLSTPGHTNESMCYAVYGLADKSAPLMVFTGDTLFAGSVGGTDLCGKAAQPEQAEKLYSSIWEKLLLLGDAVIVYPAHGAGSVCGHDISDQNLSTSGYEKKTNPFLQFDRKAFVEKVNSIDMILPRYFRKMEEYNLNGPPLLQAQRTPEAFGLSDFETEASRANTIIVDTRMPYAFCGSFIPGSLSIWLDGTSVYTGWVLDYDQRILFVHERKSDMKTTARHFWRQGFDNMIGYLCNGINEWQEKGKPTSHIGTISASELMEKLAENQISIVDVREPSEWKDGYIKGAERIFFGQIDQKADTLPKDQPTAVTCSVGNRASTAASILSRKGFRSLYNMLGGMTAWTNLGYPTKKD